MFNKFHISRPGVIEKLEALSFAIMDDQILRAGSVSFQVMQALSPELTPEESFIVNMSRVRHAAYVASRIAPHLMIIKVDVKCFIMEECTTYSVLPHRGGDRSDVWRRLTFLRLIQASSRSGLALEVGSRASTFYKSREKCSCMDVLLMGQIRNSKQRTLIRASCQSKRS